MTGTMPCPHCREQNSLVHRFCGFCGASLATSCAACGKRNPSVSRFCSGCGADLRALRTSVDVTEMIEMEERRWMTILFADLSGFTSFAERSDPEDVRSMVDRCMRMLADVVDDFGGTLLQIAGDAILAVFGAPVAHEDDAERAVRAALEMQRFAQGNPSHFGGLSLRIGVNTGEVMFAPVGPTGHREKAVVGDIVNTAARLQTSAPVSGILVGEETWQATHSSIEYEPVEPLRVKNKAQPVAAWLATGSRPTPAERSLSAVPIVGRDGELQLLRRLWKRVESEAQPHHVTVGGPAGIGKSRLCREFQTIVERDGGRFLHGRSLPYGENTAYGAFAQIIKRAADVFETDSVESASAKLTGRVAQLVSELDCSSITPHLALIVGIGSSNVAADRDVLFASAARFVDALGREQPTVVYFEDAHWAERSLLDLVEFLATNLQRTPVFLLTSARPELFDVRPHWGNSLSNGTTLILEALSESAAEDLSIRLLGSTFKLPSPVTERLRLAAGGNPLFIEELAASLTQGAIDSAHTLPATLKALITARLDSLPLEQRRVVLDASVVGGTFWRGAVAALHTYRGLDGILRSLEAQDLIRRQDDSRFEGDTEFSFKHTVIRDVAYGILSKASRRKHHAVVAEFIESAPGASTAETTLLLAHHWRHSVDPLRAVGYLVAAGDQAGRGWAKQEAVTLYNHALEVMPEDDTRRASVSLKRAVAFQAWLHMSLDLDAAVKETGAVKKFD
jgi:class 3 adenylate cyclase